MSKIAIALQGCHTGMCNFSGICRLQIHLAEGWNWGNLRAKWWRFQSEIVFWAGNETRKLCDKHRCQRECGTFREPRVLVFVVQKANITLSESLHWEICISLEDDKLLYNFSTRILFLSTLIIVSWKTVWIRIKMWLARTI